jgi:DNA-binding NtrC family response regulator
MENAITHVLLIDDDITYAKTVQSQLKRFQGGNFKVTWEENGLKGIEYFKQDPSVSIVVLDFFLRESTGSYVVQELQRLRMDLPIIFVADEKDFKIAVEAMKQGAEDFLIKDEMVESILPRTILNVLNRAELKRKIAKVEKEKIISQKRSEAIKELVVTICHEFNNPLAAIKISTDIISRQKLNEQDRDSVVGIDKSIHRIEKEIIKLRDINLPS